jgi:hypothetical protein
MVLWAVCASPAWPQAGAAVLNSKEPLKLQMSELSLIRGIHLPRVTEQQGVQHR